MLKFVLGVLALGAVTLGGTPGSESTQWTVERHAEAIAQLLDVPTSHVVIVQQQGNLCTYVIGATQEQVDAVVPQYWEQAVKLGHARRVVHPASTLAIPEKAATPL